MSRAIVSCPARVLNTRPSPSAQSFVPNTPHSLPRPSQHLSKPAHRSPNTSCNIAFASLLIHSAPCVLDAAGSPGASSPCRNKHSERAGTASVRRSAGTSPPTPPPTAAANQSQTKEKPPRISPPAPQGAAGRAGNQRDTAGTQEFLGGGGGGRQKPREHNRTGQRRRRRWEL